MNYVEALAAPLRKTGQIKLHGKEAFEGMRKAGRLVADCLDMLTAEVQPGVPRDLWGHGLGKLCHDEPNIVHVGRPGEGIVLRPGMFFTVEPMINLGRPHVKVLADGWTAVTRDRSLSAQFEHTVGVTPSGVEIFTTSAKGFDKPPYKI